MNELIAYGSVVLMVVLTGIGSSIGVTIAGNVIIGSMRKNPDAFGQYIGLSALPSSQGLYDFVGFFMTNGLIKDLLTAGVFGAGAAWVIFAAGLSLDLVGPYSATRQTQVCASGTEGIGVGNNLSGTIMVMAVFPEPYAILALFVPIPTFGVARDPFLAA